jgi:hypothetical protein
MKHDSSGDGHTALIRPNAASWPLACLAYIHDRWRKNRLTTSSNEVRSFGFGEVKDTRWPRKYIGPAVGQDLPWFNVASSTCNVLRLPRVNQFFPTNWGS